MLSQVLKRTGIKGLKKGLRDFDGHGRYWDIGVVMKRFRFVILCCLAAFPPAFLFAQSLDDYPAPAEQGRWLERQKTVTGPVKAALLIGVGNHASARSEHLGWNLDVSDELSTMKSTLKSEAGFGYIETLADDKATLSNIEGFLTQRLPARLSGEGHTLLIYYTGHGVVQGQERCWFTYYTDFSSDHYSKLLTASTLADWINRLKTDKGHQGVPDHGRLRHAGETAQASAHRDPSRGRADLRGRKGAHDVHRGLYRGLPYRHDLAQG